MKELSIEEKAKRYDEAIEKLHEIITMDNKPVNPKEIGEYLFPEFKESEDEQIRKELIDFVKSRLAGFPQCEKYIAWLEKQGEQKSVEDSLTLEEFENAFITKAKQYDIDLPNRSWDIYALCKELYSLKHKPKQGKKNPAEWHIEDEQNLNACLGYIPDELLRRWLRDVIHAKYDKPINKVETKFKVGDWVVWDNKISCLVNNIYQGKESLMYMITDTHNMTRSYSVKGFDNNAHLWAIKDAKDGDVLYVNNTMSESIIIYKSFKHGIIRKYASYSKFGFEDENYLTLNDGYITPATKEQRDFLFAEMKKAGYEWNSDKKELKNCKL